MDDADVKARDLRHDLQMHCAGMLDDESVAVIAAAIRDAEQRGMLRAAEIVEDHVESFYDPKSPKGYANHRLATAASNIRRAQAIERAAEIELLDDAKQLDTTDGEG